MNDLDILHFEQLKEEIQKRYLESHTPSAESISKWKGIDIIYFQEDLRKLAKGNISEKSFYTYFKNSPVAKLPRIDILNLLSIYAGYTSWFEFKKNNFFKNEVLTEADNLAEEDDKLEHEISLIPQSETTSEIPQPTELILPPEPVLQITNTEKQDISESTIAKDAENNRHEASFNFLKNSLWIGFSVVLMIVIALLVFKDEIFSKEYTYRFIDADRNTMIKDNVEIKIIKDNGETPILVKLKPNQEFTYTTKNKSLRMLVSSTFYKEREVVRNLENAPKDETIELQPNDYAQMLYYYSKSIKDLKKKRQHLVSLISDNALIYQVYDSEQYGVETMDKQRYISLVTLPTTSLENLEVIDTKSNDRGQLTMIKFRIISHDIQNK